MAPNVATKSAELAGYTPPSQEAVEAAMVRGGKMPAAEADALAAKEKADKPPQYCVALPTGDGGWQFTGYTDDHQAAEKQAAGVPNAYWCRIHAHEPSRKQGV